MEDIIESSLFQPAYFVNILELCFQYSKAPLLLKVVLGYILNYYNANNVKIVDNKDMLYNSQCLQVNIFVWVLRQVRA